MLSNHPNVLGGNGPSASSDLIGDVDGPASATDNAVARFDGTTGKLIQNSVVTISDTTGDIAGAQSLTSPASNNLTLAGGSSGASLVLEQGANANINLTPSGTGSIISSISGTAFYPSFAVGANTGLFFASASSLGFSTAGTERARFVGSTGDFLLSSTTAASSNAGALVVAGGGSFGGATYIGGTLATNTINGISGALTITSGSGSNFNLNAGTSGGAGFNFNSIGGSSYYTSNPGEALYFRSNTDASSGATTKNSPYFAFQSKYWDGAASQNTTALIELVASTTDASNYLSIGQWNFGGNAALQLYKTSLAATFAGAVTVSGNTIIGTTSTINNARITAQFQSSSGNTGISLVDAQANNTAGFVNFYSNVTAIGSISNNGNTATSYNTSSDYRLKNSIAPMTGALAKVALLKPVTYKWISNGSDGQGFIAHELAEVAPYAVTGEKDGERMQGVDYGKITPLLAAALQEAATKIKSLEARLVALEAK